MERFWFVGGYTVPKAMDDFIVNNEKKKHFILWNEKFHSIG
jgi:hypothetical protein